MFLLVADLVVVAAVFLAGPRARPLLWAAVPVLLTSGMLGIALIGALCGRGRQRTAWIGAFVFGAGYMFLVLGRDADRPA
jgi:hypothetical protein